MIEPTSDPPTMGSDPETDNTALHEQHHTDNKATSITSQTTCTEGQQHPSFQTQSQHGFSADRQPVRDAAATNTGNTLSFLRPRPALEGTPHGQHGLQMAYLPGNNEIARQLTPMTIINEEQEDNENDLTRSIQSIQRLYWDQILSLFRKQIPASMQERVLDKLCVKYPWTSHFLYRGITGCEKRKKGSGDLKKLREWMYGGRPTTHATWCDTLRTKTGDDRKVPWVKREEIMALSVILAARKADYKGDPKHMQLKRELVEECKLTYLTSNQDHVVANEYWEGFAEELKKDPDQTNLYKRIMQSKPSPIPGSSTNWPNVPIHDEEAQGHQERSDGQFLQEGYSGQAGAAGIASSQLMAGMGESIYQHSDNRDSFSPAQQTFPPAQDNGQYTKGLTGQEQSLQHRVGMLEDKNTELQKYIQLMHQNFPELLAQPPSASSPHQQ